MPSSRVAVLFVCTGNICRSPTAEGVFRSLVAEAGLEHVVTTDSAGTIAYHVGDPPDRRSVVHAGRRGYDLSDLRARQVKSADGGRFDYLLGMDRGHVDHVREITPADASDRVGLFLDFVDERRGEDVPDPYYGGDAGFEHVLDLVECGARALLDHIRVHDLGGRA